MDVWGVDVSPVAVDLARQLARGSGVEDRCRFDVVDLDGGLPPGPPVDLVLCHRFRDRRLDQAIIERLAPGGMLALAVLSEVDVGPGPFRARRGELCEAFGELDMLVGGEAEGVAWLLARRSTMLPGLSAGAAGTGG
jgi:SAM-dependent methyltransferase